MQLQHTKEVTMRRLGGWWRKKPLWVWVPVLLFFYYTATAHAAHLEVIVETDGTRFAIVSQTVRPHAAPQTHRQIFQEGSYYIETLNTKGEVVQGYSVADPTEVAYDYLDQADHGQPSDSSPTRPQRLQGGRLKFPTGQMTLRLPVDAKIRRLRISRQRRSAKAKGSDVAPAALQVPTTQRRLPKGLELEHKAALALDPLQGERP